MEKYLQKSNIYNENENLKKELDDEKYNYLFKDPEKTNKKGHFDYFDYLKQMNESVMKLKNKKLFRYMCCSRRIL